jgi:uncharacterized membrane protein
MPDFDGASQADVHVPIREVFAIVADIERVPLWQPDVKHIECIERDRKGRAVVVRTVLETVLRRTEAVLRFEFEEHHRVSWSMEDGDAKTFEGSWTLADLDGARTRVDYAVTIDLGRGFGMLVRGPAAKALGNAAASSMPRKLKAFAEAEAGAPAASTRPNAA